MSATEQSKHTIPGLSTVVDGTSFLVYIQAMLKKDVLTFYGSQAQVARVLGITRQWVNRWPDIVPKAAALELQYLTGGQLQMDRSLYGKRRRRKKTDS